MLFMLSIYHFQNENMSSLCVSYDFLKAENINELEILIKKHGNYLTFFSSYLLFIYFIF